MPAIAVAVVAVGAGSAAQAVTGFGFSLLCMPVLVLLVTPARAVPLGISLAMLVNAAVLAREHRELHLLNAARLLVPAVAVTPLAAYLVRRADAAVLSISVGVLVVGCALVLAAGRRAPRLHGAPGMLAAGAISAAMNTASGLGGPAVAFYALNAGWSAEMTRPTLQVYFVGLNAIALWALGPVVPQFSASVALASAVVGGYVVGSLVVTRISATVVGRAVLVLSVAGGIAAVARGVALL